MSSDSHRRQGAYAEFTPWKITDDFKEAIRRVDDLSPVMQKVAFAARDEATARLASGSEFVPLAETTIERRNRPSGSHSGSQPGIGRHGGFSSSILPFWGKRNAGWKTPAPHANLFSHGIQWHTGPGGKRTGLYREVSAKKYGLKRRRSVPEIRKLSKTLGNADHAPAREFDYISGPLADRALSDTADYVLFFGEKLR